MTKPYEESDAIRAAKFLLTIPEIDLATPDGIAIESLRDMDDTAIGVLYHVQEKEHHWWQFRLFRTKELRTFLGILRVGQHHTSLEVHNTIKAREYFVADDLAHELSEHLNVPVHTEYVQGPRFEQDPNASGTLIC